MRHLREKAEQAAEASVHHASLSQQYLDLSQKFSQLAEQAGSTALAELQATLKSIEQQSPTNAVAATVAASNSKPTALEALNSATNRMESQVLRHHTTIASSVASNAFAMAME